MPTKILKRWMSTAVPDDVSERDTPQSWLAFSLTLVGGSVAKRARGVRAIWSIDLRNWGQCSRSEVHVKEASMPRSYRASVLLSTSNYYTRTCPCTCTSKHTRTNMQRTLFMRKDLRAYPLGSFFFVAVVSSTKIGGDTRVL